MQSPFEGNPLALAAVHALVTSPQPLLVCSLPGGEIRHASRSATSLLGRSPDQFVGRTLPVVLGMDSPPAWHDADDPPTTKLSLPSGQLVGLSCVVVPHSGAALGLARLTALVASDVSRLERLEQMLNATEDFVGIVTADERPLLVSPSFSRVTGYGPEEVASSDFRTRVHPDDVELVEKSRAANLRGESTRIEYRCRCRDGSFVWLDLRATPLPGPDGRIDRIVWTSRDVSERKRLEQELRDSRRFIEQVADTIPQMLFVYDLKELRHVWVNGQCKGVRGCTPGELLRMKPGESLEQIHPADRLQTEEVMRRLMAAPEGEVMQCLYRIRHPERGWRRLRTRCLVFRRAEDGRPWQVLGVSEDVTDEQTPGYQG